MAGKLSVTGLWKSFATRRGRLSVLEGVNLTVAESEFVAIIGPSGCGKSTLLNILAGFDPADRGQVTIDGQAVTGPSRSGIFIFQQGAVFPWLTVERNLTFGLDGMPRAEKRRLAAHYIDLVGLQGFEHAYPWQLSGGMRQRVEVARALIVKPEILFMDEPFAALDALTRLRMRTELRRILARERHTTLMVTHDVEEALHLADRIVIMSPRPARVQLVLDVTVPHPRSLSDFELMKMKLQILKELGVAGVLASEHLTRDTAARSGRREA
jgi:NitT/TauT family transport system ATP-binding protein/sulfonate transport system ATP-binding protein